MKIKKIGILFDDRRLNSMDFSKIEDGNPGVGGTEYCFLMLAYYCAKYLNDYQIEVLHYNNAIKLPNIVNNVLVTENSWDVVILHKIDIIIFRGGFHRNDGFLEFMERNNLKAIAWAHNFLTYSAANQLSMLKCVKRVIFVSQQMYEHYIDHDVIFKSTYIYNFVSIGSDDKLRKIDYDPIVVYTGSIISAKGFHLLAREWKKIVSEVPNAKLYVIGNGQLYYNNIKLGKYGIAEESYERRFIRYITDNDKNILDSVKLCGKLGVEKLSIYKRAAVGIINPSGRTETFGLSAVEMEMTGIPIVTYKRASYPDIIEQGQAGYLCKTRREFRRRIINLLKDRELNWRMGVTAKYIVNHKFDVLSITKQWCQLFEDILKNKKVEYKISFNLSFYDMKWFRNINRKLRLFFPIFPSLIWLDVVNDRCNEIKELCARHIKIYRY